MQSCLLVLLRDKPSHGYILHQRLEPFGFNLETMDKSVVYQVLRDMADQGWVQTSSEPASLGPPRQVYSITPAGARRIGELISDWRRVRREIDTLIEQFES